MTENKRSRALLFLGYAIPILLVVYVLSIGPAAAIIYDSHGSALNPEYEKLATSFYSPLLWVAEQNEYTANMFVAYIEFCTNRDLMTDD